MTSLAEEKARLVALLPERLGDWLDLSPGSDPDKVLAGAAQGIAEAQSAPLANLAADANPVTATPAAIADWEAAQGLDRTPAALTGALEPRRAQVVARWRERGYPLASRVAGSIAAVLGVVPAMVRHTRLAMRTAHTYPLAGLPLAIAPSASTQTSAVVADNAPVSSAGAQVTVTVTHPALDALSFRLAGPDGYLKTWPAQGTGAAVGRTLRLYAPEFAGRRADGTWLFTITESSGAAGALLNSSTSGLFVEGRGRAPSGAEGLAANLWEWAVIVDPAAVSALGLSLPNMDFLRSIVARWNPAHARGYLVSKNSLGGASALFDDAQTPWDGGLWA